MAVPENAVLSHPLDITRRHFFGRSAAGIGSAALASILNPSLFAGARSGHAEGPSGVLDQLHAPATAKRVIYLFMAGAPSQLETLDYKPKLDDLFDKDLPDSIRRGQRITTMTSGQSRLPVAPSKFKFSRHGHHGVWVSELLPHIGSIADDIAIVKTVHTEAINHDPAITYIQTGGQLPGRPSMGAWLSYGIGNESSDLPAFVVLHSSWSARRAAQALYSRLWGTGFLPSEYQGVSFQSKGDPVLYLSNPPGVGPKERRRMVDVLGALNQRQFDRIGDPEIETRIAQYEMAYRLQTSVPELTDFSTEPKHVLDLYGPDVHKPGTFAANCLLARRLAERGVRFTQVFIRGWDQHGNLPGEISRQ